MKPNSVVMSMCFSDVVSFQTEVGSVPVISLISHERSYIEFRCDSHSWLPEPEMIWTDQNGQQVTSGTTENPKKLQGGVLHSISSRVRIENGHTEEIFCNVMSQDRKHKFESSVQVTGEEDGIF